MNSISQLANPLWQSMCFFGFVFLVFSWVQAHKGKIAVFDSLRYIIFLLALLAVITFSRELFITGTSLINSEAEEVSTSIELFLDNAGRAAVEGENDTFAIAAPVTGIGLDIAHFLASLIRQFLSYFQWGIIFLLYSVSPLLIAFLAHPSTQNIGVRFLTTTFGVMMWQYGFVFADMIFIGTFNEVVADYAVFGDDLLVQKYALESVSEVTLTLNVSIWLMVMLIILVVLYFLAPLLVYLIFSGASPASALGGAIGTAVAGSISFSRMASKLSAMRRNSNTQNPAGGGSGSSPGPGPLSGALPALTSLPASFSMNGLGAGEVNQREQEKNNRSSQ